MARFTLYMRNGRMVEFESASVKLTTKHDKSTGRHIVTDMEYFKKDGGISLIFADYAEIESITRDTTRNDD